MTQEFVTLPREVVEQALEALINEGEFRKLLKPLIEKSIDSIRAALKQPQNHVPDAGNMAPAGWKLVPVEPTDEMVEAGDHEIEKWGVDASSSGVFRAMLAAAPQPPEHYDQQALDLCMTCGWKTMIPGDCCLNCARQKPQVEQEPVAVIGDVWTFNWVGSGPIYQIVKKHGLKIGDKLYTHPQPRREPLTDKRISRLWSDAHNDTTDRMAFQVLARAIEQAHNIK